MTDAAYCSDSMEFIRSSLLELGINRKLVQKTELLCEESIIMLAEHAPEGGGAAGADPALFRRRERQPFHAGRAVQSLP